MGERTETPGAPMSPEEYKAAEGITPEVEKAHDAHALDDEETEEEKFQELAEKRFQHSTPLQADLVELNRIASEKLGIEWPIGPNEDTFNPKEGPYQEPKDSMEAEAEASVEALMPTAEFNERIGHSERADDSKQINVERRTAMQHEINEGMMRYREAFTDATNVLLLRPRSETVKQRWVALTLQNNRDLTTLAALVEQGTFLDPVVIRAKFDAAAEHLRKFAEDADKS